MRPEQDVRLLVLTCAMLLAACLGLCRPAEAAPIELLREVRASGTDLALLDLLPADASARLRERAARIPLGAAPLCGKTRVLDGQNIARHLGHSSDLKEQISVPDRVVVSCGSHPLTMDEVLAAVKGSLRAEGTPHEELTPQDLSWQTDVFVGPDVDSLRVIHRDFDVTLNRARFLLSSSAAGGNTRFLVTARMAANAGRIIPNLPVASGRPAHAPGLPPLVKPLPVVQAGTPAHLVLRSSTMQMAETVLPLESGIVGQQVLVRVLDTGKVARARVAGPGHLEIQF